MPSLRLRGLVIAGIVFSNLIVFALTGYSLLTSHRNHEQRAEVLTQNIARALELNLANSTEKIDLLLRSTADELQRQLATSQGIDEQGMQFFLARQQDRIPDLEGLRVADASGLVFLGKDAKKEDKITWADREYFIYHRDHDDRTLQISKPRMGRVAKQYIVGFAMRYNHPDGRFAGVISATLPLDYYSQLLARFDVGPHGTISLRDNDLGLITRFPAIPDKPAGQIGNKVLSPEFMQLFGSGIASATFKTPASGDGFQRIITYHKLGYVPMIAIVGTADKDYLEHWYDEVYLALAVVLGFFGLSLILGRLTLFFLRRTEVESERNRLYLQQASDGIHILDSDGRLIEASDSFFKMLGYGREELIGASVAQWDARWPADELLHDILPAKLALTVPSTQETRHRRKDGSLIDIELNLDAFDIDGKRYLYAAARDITERKQAEARSHQLAYFDALTGLPNRRMLAEHFDRLASAVRREGRGGFALLLLDMDRFKQINDSLGHAAGDALLQATAERLRQAVREVDTVARIGGDEFAILLSGLSEPHAIEPVCRRIVQAFEAPVMFHGQAMQTSPSFGVACYPAQGRTLDALSREADRALYEAKDGGRNTWRFATTESGT